jgi:hypothetical protein
VSHASPVRRRAGEAREPLRIGTARRWAALGGVALLAVACGQTGSATTRIDAAEVEVETIVEDIVESVSLQTDEEIGVGTRSSCELVTGGAGGSNTLSLRGSLPDVDDPVGRASAVLVEAGYELIDSEEELGEGVFGRRDGIRITVVVDGPTEQLAIDAATGCRPPPSA